MEPLVTNWCLLHQRCELRMITSGEGAQISHSRRILPSGVLTLDNAEHELAARRIAVQLF
jgi:hypothetical protein